MNRKLLIFAVVTACEFAIGISCGLWIADMRAEKGTQKTVVVQSKCEQEAFFKTYPKDFLVPLNRLVVPNGSFIYNEDPEDMWNKDPMELHGSFGGAPMWSFLCYIEDNQERKRHYFLCSSQCGHRTQGVSYLGDDIEILSNPELVANAIYGFSYRRAGSTNSILEIFDAAPITGSPPENYGDPSIVSVKMNTIVDERYSPQEKRDLSWMDGMTNKQFYDKLRKAVISEDKRTVAQMIQYPLRTLTYPDRYDVVIQSEKEFVDKYDLIVSDYNKEQMREGNDILYHPWRGVELGGFWMSYRNYDTWENGDGDEAWLIDGIVN